MDGSYRGVLRAAVAQIAAGKCRWLDRCGQAWMDADGRIQEEDAMVKHVILWTLKDEYSGAEIDRIKADIKSGLEGLKGVIPGLIEIKVNVKPLQSSNCDLMLDSLFENEEALKGYAVHPSHVEVANTKVRPFTASRVCMDYEV